jgi:hypothetical protein
MSGKPLTSAESIRLLGAGRNDHLTRTIARLYLSSAPALLEAMRDAVKRRNAALQSVPELLQEIDAATAAVCAILTERIKTPTTELSA